MTNEQAIKSLKNIKEYRAYKPTENYYEELDCGELYDKGYIYNCPNCDNEVGGKSLEFEEMFWQTDYCPYCGQKLDWS